MEVKEKTKLEHMLLDKNVSFTSLKDIMGVKDYRTASAKVHGSKKFNLPEMKAIQSKLFPDMTLEEIFEGY